MNLPTELRAFLPPTCQEFEEYREDQQHVLRMVAYLRARGGGLPDTLRASERREYDRMVAEYRRIRSLMPETLSPQRAMARLLLTDLEN